ncbi:hypothetical protein GGF31_008983 [Allomyces arbusculus]|nr:hypothetical protein GGF31_008983 [Allomyces arbusculus]
MADPVDLTLALRYQGGPGRPGRLLPPTLQAAGHAGPFADLTDAVTADPLLARCSPRTRAAARFFAAVYTMAASWMVPLAGIDAAAAANLVAGPFPNDVNVTPELLSAALRLYCTPVAVRPLPDHRWIMAFQTPDDANYVLCACDRQLAVGGIVVVPLRAATDHDLTLLGPRVAPAKPAPPAVPDAHDEFAVVLDEAANGNVDAAANVDVDMDVVPEPVVEPQVDAPRPPPNHHDEQPDHHVAEPAAPPPPPPLEPAADHLVPTPDPPAAHTVSILGHPPIGPFVAGWKCTSPPGAGALGWVSHSDPPPPPSTTAAAAAPSPAASTHMSPAPPPPPSSFVAEPGSPWNDPIMKAPLTGWGAAGWSDGSGRGTWERLDSSITSAAQASSASSSWTKVGGSAAPARQWTTPPPPPPARGGPRVAGGWTREPPPPADGMNGHGRRRDRSVPSNGGAAVTGSTAAGTKRARARTPSPPAPPPPEPPRKRVSRCVVPPPPLPPSSGWSSMSVSVSPPPVAVPAGAAAAAAENAARVTAAAAAVPIPPSMSPSPVVVTTPPPPPPAGRGNNVIDLDDEEEASNGGAAASATSATSPPRQPNDRPGESHRPSPARAAAAAGAGNVIDLSDSDDDYAPGPSRATAATTTTKAPPRAPPAPPTPDTVPVVERTVVLTISRGATTAMVRKAIAQQWDEPSARVDRGDQIDADHVEYTIVLDKPWDAQLQTTLDIAEQRWNVRPALPLAASDARDWSQSRESRRNDAAPSSSSALRAVAPPTPRGRSRSPVRERREKRDRPPKAGASGFDRAEEAAAAAADKRGQRWS